MTGEQERMCPSTTVENSTVFLGMITPARKVAYVTPQVLIDFVRDTLDDSAGPLERRYRFAGPCVTSNVVSGPANTVDSAPSWWSPIRTPESPRSTCPSARSAAPAAGSPNRAQPHARPVHTW